MSDCIDTVGSLMPSSSHFRDSDVESILDETIGVYFDSKEEEIEDVLDAPFLTEATGDYLDLLHGKLYGIERVDDETDDDYKRRLTFQAKDTFRLSDLKELGCRVYLHVTDFDEDTTLTSRRITNCSNKLVIDCPSPEIEELVKQNWLWEKQAGFI
jgi:hypothetical protein